MIRLPPRSTRTTHSFPTRRSSDLGRSQSSSPSDVRARDLGAPMTELLRDLTTRVQIDVPRWTGTTEDWRGMRSEEHTSELQSLMRSSYAVFCLQKTQI